MSRCYPDPWELPSELPAWVSLHCLEGTWSWRVPLGALILPGSLLQIDPEEVLIFFNEPHLSALPFVPMQFTEELQFLENFQCIIYETNISPCGVMVLVGVVYQGAEHLGSAVRQVTFWLGLSPAVLSHILNLPVL